MVYGYARVSTKEQNTARIYLRRTAEEQREVVDRVITW